MIIFDALLECLKEDLKISKEVVDKAKDLYSLSTIFEGNLYKIVSEEDAKYIKEMNTCLKRKDFKSIQHRIPPRNFKKYHRKLVRYCYILNKEGNV